MSLFNVAEGVTGGNWLWQQIIDAINGNNDIGSITAFVPVSAPGAPTAAVSTSSGNLTGNYQYAVGFSTGYWDGPVGTGTYYPNGNTGGGTASNVVAPSSEQVSLSAIPTGPTGVYERYLYRTKANGSVFYYLATLADNTTTTYTDNTADTSLGAQMPTTNTTGTEIQAWKLIASALSTFQAGVVLSPITPLTQAGALSQTDNQLYMGNGTTAQPVGSNPLVSPLTYAL